MGSADQAEFDEVEAAMLKLIEDADLPEPDEIRREEGSGELVFLWHSQKLAVVVAMEDS